MSDVTDPKANSEANLEGAAAGADPGKTETQGSEQAPAAKQYSQEAYSALQSQKDKAEADVRRAREDSARAVEAALKDSRQVQLAALKPEERDATIKSWNLDDKERRLAETERELEETARSVTISKLSVDYGIDPKDLEGIEDVNEMRAKAAELKVDRLQKELADAKAGAGTAPAAKPAVPAGMRGDPAGSGSGGKSSYDSAKYKGSGDLAGALKAKREAGEVTYERIPIRGR